MPLCSMLMQYFQECVLGACLQIFRRLSFPATAKPVAPHTKGENMWSDRYRVPMLVSVWAGRENQHNNKKEKKYSSLQRRENNKISATAGEMFKKLLLYARVSEAWTFSNNLTHSCKDFRTKFK